MPGSYRAVLEQIVNGLFAYCHAEVRVASRHVVNLSSWCRAIGWVAVGLVDDLPRLHLLGAQLDCGGLSPEHYGAKSPL
jgi:rhamnogalacturonyl hydrolase YesR